LGKKLPTSGWGKVFNRRGQGTDDGRGGMPDIPLKPDMGLFFCKTIKAGRKRTSSGVRSGLVGDAVDRGAPISFSCSRKKVAGKVWSPILLWLRWQLLMKRGGRGKLAKSKTEGGFFCFFVLLFFFLVLFFFFFFFCFFILLFVWGWGVPFLLIMNLWKDRKPDTRDKTSAKKIPGFHRNLEWGGGWASFGTGYANFGVITGKEGWSRCRGGLMHEILEGG